VSGEAFVVVGAGGHAKVVISAIEAAGGRIASILDDHPARWGMTVLGHPVTGPVARHAIPADAAVILALGSNRDRANLSRRLRVRYGTVIHPSAVVHPTVSIGEGTVIFAGVVIQADTRVGPHTIVNTSASIDHDGQIGSFTHVAPGAHLAGSVTIGEGTLLGVGCSIIPGITVGEWAVVGAGAVVIEPVPGGATAVGCPARLLKRD